MLVAPEVVFCGRSSSGDMSDRLYGDGHGFFLCSLTFELTPTAEAGAVSPVTDDATTGRHRAYSACRSGSGVERGVRPHSHLRAVKPQEAPSE